MAATDSIARLRPYVEELAENSSVRANLRNAAENLRAAYERSQKRRVKAARDEKLRRQVQAAAASAAEAARTLTDARRKSQRRRGRRIALALAAGGAAAGAVLVARGSSGGASADAPTESERTVAPSPSGAAS
jgi:ferric-dicitrate binding protein FerR (iron transport regulator)